MKSIKREKMAVRALVQLASGKLIYNYFFTAAAT